jgi:hypothetical protein
VSYCRFVEADVYVFMHVGGHLECCACILHKEDWGSFQADSTQKMIDHLIEHKNAGHHIPEHVYANLWADDAENFSL